jgi:hypothetical protein
VPRHPDAGRRRSSRRRAYATRSSRRRGGVMSRVTSHVMSRATCWGTRTRGRGEVVNDEPAWGGVVDDKRRDEPRDVPRHPDTRDNWNHNGMRL